MNRVIVSLPDDMHTQIRRLARSEKVSVSEYVSYALAQLVEESNIEPLGSNARGKFAIISDISATARQTLRGHHGLELY